MKRRQPFTHLHETAGETETKTKGANDQPRGERMTPTSPGRLKTESASKRKMRLGVSVSN
jgi:hypothetical protein